MEPQTLVPEPAVIEHPDRLHNPHPNAENSPTKEKKAHLFQGQITVQPNLLSSDLKTNHDDDESVEDNNASYSEDDDDVQEKKPKNQISDTEQADQDDNSSSSSSEVEAPSFSGFSSFSTRSYYSQRVRYTKQQDPHDLHERFVSTHKSHFPSALQEIKNGRKCSCWSWYILPTAPWIVNGIERGSWTNREYSLRTDEQARAYLTLKPTDPIAEGVDLRSNYLKIVTAIGDAVARGVSVRSLMGVLDDPKMRSSVKLFERISFELGDTELNKACQRTMRIIGEKIQRKKGTVVKQTKNEKNQEDSEEKSEKMVAKKKKKEKNDSEFDEFTLSSHSSDENEDESSEDSSSIDENE